MQLLKAGEERIQGGVFGKSKTSRILIVRDCQKQPTWDGSNSIAHRVWNAIQVWGLMAQKRLFYDHLLVQNTLLDFVLTVRSTTYEESMKLIFLFSDLWSYHVFLFVIYHIFIGNKLDVSAAKVSNNTTHDVGSQSIIFGLSILKINYFSSIFRAALDMEVIMKQKKLASILLIFLPNIWINFMYISVCFYSLEAASHSFCGLDSVMPNVPFVPELY